MKIKHFYPLLAVFAFSGAYAQVGINTANPQSTLDVVGNVASTSAKDGVTAPRLTRQQLAAKVAGTYAAAQSGTLVYVTDFTTPTGTTPSLAQTTNITKVGYYYFDGTVWKQISDTDSPSVNIYNSDGSLTGNRTVTQAANTLAFTSTAVNGFSVDGTTFSVDAANNRIGFGTIAPTSKFDIVSDNEGSAAGNDFNFRGFGTSKNPAFFLSSAGGTLAAPTNLTTGDIAGSIYFTSRANSTGVNSIISSAYRGDGTTALTDLMFTTSNAERMRIDPTGNVGIGNTSPTVKLDINSGGTPTTPVAAIKIVDGNQGTGKILTSDTNGLATWQDAGSASVNLYNSNGSLTGNRVVTQAANTLAFTSTATNGFSVDGSTLSVDAANDRVGIGTTTPVAKIDAVGSTFGMRTAGIGTWDNLWFDLANTSAPAINASGAETGLQFKVGANVTGTYGDGQTLTTVATLRPNGNVGIGTAAPNSILDLGTTNGGASATDAAGKKLAVFNNAGGTDFYGLGINTNYLQFHAGSAATAAPGMVLGSSGNVGIANTSPTNTLDVNGTARVRTMNTTAANDFVTPVYADANGVLVKANSTTVYGVVRNSVTIASGATGQAITGLTGYNKITVISADSCGYSTLIDYYLTATAFNSNFAIKGIDGIFSGGSTAASKAITFNESAKNTTGVTITGKPGCADGGSTAALNYTISTPSAGTVNITNDGNVSRTFSITVTRLN